VVFRTVAVNEIVSVSSVTPVPTLVLGRMSVMAQLFPNTAWIRSRRRTNSPLRHSQLT
jgi:hypothetical protein